MYCYINRGWQWILNIDVSSRVCSLFTAVPIMGGPTADVKFAAYRSDWCALSTYFHRQSPRENLHR